MNRLTTFLKKEAVFCIAALAALISAFFVPPSKEYIGYINFSVLGMLFALMGVVAGMSGLGVFKRAAELLIAKTNDLRTLVFVLWGLCFFSAMLITNDVALITFVPLAITVLKAVDAQDRIINTVVLQTAAANLGSMLTPIGNPQNLYIYDNFGIAITDFFAITLPYTLISFVLLVISTFILIKKRQINVTTGKTEIKNKHIFVLYCLLAALCLLTVVKVLDYRITVIVVLCALLAADRKTLAKIDWFLLLTFVMFFIFVGNISAIDAIKQNISKMISGREVIFAVLLSQVISNVPCAAMLSGFTANYKALLIGTNIGGMGTLVASLASLISFRLYAAEKESRKGRYLAVFTIIGLTFLAVLYLCYIVL